MENHGESLDGLAPVSKRSEVLHADGSVATLCPPGGGFIVRRSILLFGLLALSFTLCAAPLEHGPYTGAPDADAITISWRGDPWPATVEVAPSDSFETEGAFTHTVDVLDVEDDQANHLRIDGLLPGTDYVYRVSVQSGSQRVVSEIGRFRTKPAPGNSVSFIILSDTQWQWEGVNRLQAVADAVLAGDCCRDRTPDFILHAGDIVESPTSVYWDHWFDSFSEVLRMAPFVPVLGNHEKNNSSYYKAFDLPPGGGTWDKRWWALHWGDVVVVGLDTNASRADRIRAQQAWAEEHLSGLEPHKFVIFHHPVFSSDAYHGSGYSYDVIYHPIFVEAGVDIVFNGHAHNYERIEKDGVTYVVVGGSGAVPRALAETHVEDSVLAVEGRNFYTRVTASPDGIDVEIPAVAIADDDRFEPISGVILDRFTVGEPAVESTTRYGSAIWIGLAAVAAIALWAMLRGAR